MTEVLTLMAEEIGRAFALISSGVGVAVKLNYEVMSTFITLTSRIIQLLFLLTHKTVQLFNILGNDLFLFFGDIGSGVISVYKIMLRLGNGFSNVILVLGTSVVSVFSLIYESFCSFQGFINDLLNNCYIFAINFFQLIKYVFVLFGSSIMFGVSFIPNLLHLLFTNALKFLFNAYNEGTTFIEDSIIAFKMSVKFYANSIVSYFTEIPVSSVIGVILGVLLFITLKCLIHFILVNNLYMTVIINLSSFFIGAKQRICHYLTCVTMRTHTEEQAHEIEEASLNDDAYENGNVNENRLSRVHSNDEMHIMPRNISNISDNATTMHTQLTRRPLPRKNRVYGISNVKANCEINKTYSNCKDKNQSKSQDLALAEDLFKELENEREGKLCIICQDNPKTVILLPCRHLCLCEACRSAVIVRRNVCPVCRKPILDSLKVYL
ncbi:UNVERIFIED_CONTAM: hypothetical protein RMT77_000701 [Armadillidium vulgare]